MKTLLPFILITLLSTNVQAQCTPTATIVVSNGPACPQNTHYYLGAMVTNQGSSPTYEWYKNGVLVTNVNADPQHYPFSSTTLVNGDVIKVIMTSSASCATPTTATDSYIVVYNLKFPTDLTVNPTGKIQTGTNVTFTGDIHHGAYMYYYWFYINGVSVYNGATTYPTFTYSTNTLKNGDVVYCTTVASASSNSCGLTDTSNSITMSVNTVLPIDLLSFTAKQISNNIGLNWSAVSENNGSHFVIFASTDGTRFDSIGLVNLKENSGEKQTYSSIYVPTNITTQTYYFKIKMVDKDGIFKFSDIKSVTIFKLGPTISVFPNPASNIVNVNGDKINFIELYDLTGKLILQKQALLINNMIEISNFPKGIYILKVQKTNGEMNTQKIIIQ